MNTQTGGRLIEIYDGERKRMACVRHLQVTVGLDQIFNLRAARMRTPQGETNGLQVGIWGNKNIRTLWIVFLIRDDAKSSQLAIRIIQCMRQPMSLQQYFIESNALCAMTEGTVYQRRAIPNTLCVSDLVYQHRAPTSTNHIVCNY